MLHSPLGAISSPMDWVLNDTRQFAKNATQCYLGVLRGRAVYAYVFKKM